MGTASAKPGKLQAFVDAAGTIRGELEGRISSLRSAYDSFQYSGSSYVGNPDLMGVDLPGLVTNYQNDETFVSVVRAAFVEAGGTTEDGRVVVDEVAFTGAFNAICEAAGIDPATLTAEREPVTVDAPIAAGTPPTSGFVADPVCTATGHLVEVEEDFTWPDRLGVLRWQRTYSSRFVAAGPFGRGWASWASVALVEDADGSVGYQGPDGQMAVFTPSLDLDDERGMYGRVSGIAARLVRVDGVDGNGDGGGWELRWDRSSGRPGAVWSFDADGLIRGVADPSTGTVTFAYTGGLPTGVAHEGGRSLALDWDGARVRAVRSSCGRTARYRYDDAGDLVRVERVLGDRRYVCDDRGRLVEVWDADGVRLCRNTFDDEGRVVTQISPFGRETTFAYHPGRRTVVSDTEDGPVSIYEHDSAGRLVGLTDHQGHVMRRRFDGEGRCVEATGFGGATDRQEFAADGSTATRVGPDGVERRWDYDEAGRVAAHEVEGGPRLGFDYEGASPFPSAMRGPDGWEMRFDISPEGLVTAMTDADGVIVRFDHDADGNVVGTTDASGATTRTVPHVSGLPRRVTQPDGAAYEIDRDDAGRMLALRTPLGHTYSLQWTAAGRLAGMVDPDEGHTSFEHGTHGALERIVDALGGVLELSHDHLERLVGLTAPGGAKWSFSYTGTGLLSLVGDPGGGTWGYDYDAEGRMVVATDPLGHEVRQSYDHAGRLAEVIDRAGNVTNFSYDARGRLVATDAPEAATTAYEWDTWGRPSRVRFPDGDALTYTYTPAGRVRTVTTAEGRGWTNDYDPSGRLVAVTDAAGATTRFTWDECGRLVESRSPAGRVDRLAYDPGGRVVESTRGGRTWRAGYDHAGRLTELTDAAGATRRYRYDLRGKLVAATDPLGNQVRIRYDERGNPVGVVDAFGGFTSTTYDAMRRPVAVTDQLGRTTRLVRDAAGRVVRRELPTGDVVEWDRDPRGLTTDVRVNGRDAVVFDHDGAGRPVLVHEPDRNRTFTLGWSRGGRLASLDVDGAAMTWGRDADGLVVSRRDPAGRAVRYTRDPAGRLTAVASDRWGTVELDRDPDGRLVALRAPGITRRWDHDPGGLVAAYHQTGADDDQATTTLVRDVAGRVTDTHGPDGDHSYRYDPAGQLVGAVTPHGTWTWAYDEAGRLAREDGPDGTTTYTYDDAHQLVSITGPAGTTGFSYDAAGRRTEQAGPTGTRRYDWNGLGRLTGITEGDRRREVDVDALGRLAAYDGTTFTWDSSGPVADLVAIGDDEVVGAAGHVLGLATPDGAVDRTGADRQRSPFPGRDPATDRDPWGATPPDAAGAGPGIGSLGELDLGGLTWLRHRLYDPATRQFVAPDPLPGIPGTTVASTPYHYGNNDPVGMVDPLGLEPLSIDAYNEIREQETGMQWGNIAMGALMVGSFFIPGGPIIATLVGAGMGMAPGIIQGVTTGNWDVSEIVQGAVVGGIAGRVGFAFGGSGSTLTTSIVRGAAGGATTGTVGQAYDVLPLPGSDGQFDLEDVALETVIGGVTGGMGHRPTNLDAVPGGTTLTANGDRFGTYASRAQPLPGYHDVVIHGSPTNFGQTPDAWQTGRTIDHRSVANGLRADPNYDGGPVRLISCETGAPGGTAAQNLSNKLNTEVLAPTDTVWAYPDGTLTVGPTATSNSGGWDSFTPSSSPPGGP